MIEIAILNVTLGNLRLHEGLRKGVLKSIPWHVLVRRSYVWSKVYEECNIIFNAS